MHSRPAGGSAALVTVFSFAKEREQNDLVKTMFIRKTNLLSYDMFCQFLPLKMKP